MGTVRLMRKKCEKSRVFATVHLIRIPLCGIENDFRRPNYISEFHKPPAECIKTLEVAHAFHIQKLKFYHNVFH